MPSTSTDSGARSNCAAWSLFSGRITVAARSVQLPTGSPSSTSARSRWARRSKRGNHIGEAAAEATAGHLLDARAGDLEDLAIDQVGRLIVGHQADAIALLRQSHGRLGQERRLAGARKPPTRISRGIVMISLQSFALYTILHFGSDCLQPLHAVRRHVGVGDVQFLQPGQAGQVRQAGIARFACGPGAGTRG